MKFTKAIKNFENGYLTKKHGTNKWIVVKEFVWYLDYDNREGKITIPLGFVTDFGSIPQIFWGIYNPTKYVAYILHDFMYSESYKDFEKEKFFKQYFQEKNVYWELEEKVEKYVNKKLRKKADKILREALQVEGMGKIKRNLVYLAVRLFGGVFYQNDNKK